MAPHHKVVLVDYSRKSVFEWLLETFGTSPKRGLTICDTIKAGHANLLESFFTICGEWVGSSIIFGGLSPSELACFQGTVSNREADELLSQSGARATSEISWIAALVPFLFYCHPTSILSSFHSYATVVAFTFHFHLQCYSLLHPRGNFSYDSY